MKQVGEMPLLVVNRAGEKLMTGLQRKLREILVLVGIVTVCVVYYLSVNWETKPEEAVYLIRHVSEVEERTVSEVLQDSRTEGVGKRISSVEYGKIVYKNLGESPWMEDSNKTREYLNRVFREDSIGAALEEDAVKYRNEAWKRMLLKFDEIQKEKASADLGYVRRVVPTGRKMNLAVVACGSRLPEAIMMLKSAILFSQDSSLHVIVFSDKNTILGAAEEVLGLRWKVNAAGWDFTFELHEEWFPDPNWRGMYQACATQRVFFPTILTHIDALIYLDTDIVVISNVTEMWNIFPNGMKGDKLAGLAPNNEPAVAGWYGSYSQIPYYGKSGLNAGVMLMNLTQMREFNIVKRSEAANVLYAGKMYLADQDIYNIIFHTFPEKLYPMDCSYNFHWYYCGRKGYTCKNSTTGEHFCFCQALHGHGAHIIHGNSGTFYSGSGTDDLHFLQAIAKEFTNFNIVTDSPVMMIQRLKDDYLSKPQDICGPMNVDMLYGNAENYFKNLYFPV